MANHGAVMSIEAPDQRVGFAALPDMADLIRRRSVNHDDIRSIFLHNIDFSRTRSVLDLGCGIGFLTDRIARRLPAGAAITGIDPLADHRAAYLRQLRATGRRVRFLCREIRDRLPWPDQSYDLVVCSYSLYLFADAIPEMARILRPDGLLMASTHSPRTFHELVAAAGLAGRLTPLQEMVARFNRENGRSLLAPHFRSIQRVDYPNRLEFGPEAIEDLIRYTAYKLPGLLPGTPAVPAGMRAALEAVLRTRGSLCVDKSDCCFYARGPASSPRAAERRKDGTRCH